MVDLFGEKNMLQTNYFTLISKSFTTHDRSLMPWTDLSSISSVTYKAGATACADETTIYYIGGFHRGGFVSKFDTKSLRWGEPNTSGSIPREAMKYVHCLPISIFNINDNTWRIVTTSGKIPTRKCNHASVYILDDITINSLDILTFTWTIPVILNSGGPLRCLVDHTATLIGAYVLIAFGYYQTDDDEFTSSDIFLLDVSQKDSYKWVTTYDPINSIQPIPASPTSPTSPSNINIGAVIAGTIGVVIGMSLGGVIMRFLNGNNRNNYADLP
ncbi:kelch repeat protein [Gigaspora margarita]|uniref:Kelch repeat protein n=1 Tax=Gigaspora margarita TaxID=4874 RepID=A0A8H3X708_GIGMA|nr:kelch repeat protein [Gigaspora margarita]